MGKKLTPQEKTLDKWFSLYIRRRDTPGPCCTCGKWLTFEDSECGHFITRDRHAVRWDERNAHAQCTRCNLHGKGEQHKHGEYVNRKHGEGTTDLLWFKAQAPAHFTTEEIKAMSNRFRLIVREGPF